MRTRRAVSLGFLAALLILGGVGYWLRGRAVALDTRYNGAYRFDDGELLLVTAREGDTLRYRRMGGESRALRPSDSGDFTAGPGWSDAEPVEVTVSFDGSDRLTWKDANGARAAQRVDLPEVQGRFLSGEIELRAKLVLPEGTGPFPVVVFVHGSGRESAVDTYYNPYLFAAHGIAGLVYDKRGTGDSGGKYTQNFHVLSDDTAAAVEWLKADSGVDPSSIHLAGYSQGGWIAPLAATKADVTSLLIAYGPMVPVTGEDRWGYVYALEQAGFGAEEVAEVDEINEIASAIMDRREDRWAELKEALAESESRPWYEAVRESDSMIGFLSSTRLPWWAVRLYGWWNLRQDPPFIDRLYDPVPTVGALTIPSLWIFGGEDSSMPTGWSIDELDRLRALGRPVHTEVFPAAEHGIVLFEDGDDGRRLLGYAPGYLALQVDWVRLQIGLDPISARGRREPETTETPGP